MSADLTLSELWRLLGVVDVAVLIGCAMYLHAGYRDQIPVVLWRLGYAYGAFLGTVALGLVANWLSTFPPTPGAKIVALVGAFSAIYAVRVTWRVAAHRD